MCTTTRPSEHRLAMIPVVSVIRKGPNKTIKKWAGGDDVFDDVIGNVRASGSIGDLADDSMRGAVDV